MRTLVLTAEFDRDLEAIWIYIAADNFDAADRVKDEIKAEIQKLLDQPSIGHTREDVRNRSIRFWKIYSYLIVYRYDDRELVVLRVIHGARDIGSIIR